MFFVLSMLAAGLLLVGQLEDGWWHHDDGSFGQMAERVLDGELPHRDFADLYTGLLTFLNAGVFAVLGEDLFNLRLPLVALFLVYVACFFALARRFLGAGGAFVATLFAITWTLPVYPAPMPSWYLLFLATIGLYAVVRYFESGLRRWLLLAGICGGVAIAIKITGIWFVAAVVLAVLARPLLDGQRRDISRMTFLRHPFVVLVAALLALLLLTAVFSGHPVPSAMASLFVPTAILCIAVAFVGWRARLDRRPGIDHSIAEAGLFLLGVTLPIAIFLVPYVVTGSLVQLAEGVLISPRTRYEFSSYEGPGAATLLRAAPVVLLLLLRSRVTERWRQLLDVGVAALIALLIVTASSDLSYSIVWGTTRALAPCIVILGAVLIAQRRSTPGIPSSLVALVVLVAGFGTLVQFPFAAPVYFLYAAPLILLSAIVASRVLGASGILPVVALIALIVFGARQLDQQTLVSLGYSFQTEPRVQLDSERASIGIHPAVKAEYDRVRGLVEQHAGRNGAIFAGPDAPEIYYLTRSRNTTPAIIDFLDASGSTRGRNLLGLLRERDVSVVIINLAPHQSPQLESTTVHTIRARYRGGTRVGNFEVRWLDSRARQDEPR